MSDERPNYRERLAERIMVEVNERFDDFARPPRIEIVEKTLLVLQEFGLLGDDIN